MKGKSDAYKQLICIMQRACIVKSESMFSDVKTNIYFVIFGIVVKKNKKKQIECGLAWSVILSTTIRVITVVKMLCNKLSYVTKRALCFSY